jgi:hypothetical protein
MNLTRAPKPTRGFLRVGLAAWLLVLRLLPAWGTANA